MDIIKQLHTFIHKKQLHDDRSLVTLSYAQSLDGSIALAYDVGLRMSGHDAQGISHTLRTMHDAVIVGIGTVLSDNPRLTVRHVSGNNPQPVVLDSSLRFPLTARLVSHPRAPWIFTNDQADIQKKEQLEKIGIRILRAKATSDNKIDLAYALRELKFMGMNRVLVEGGATIIDRFIREQVVDVCIVFITPVFVGGLHPIKQLDQVSAQQTVDDFPWLEIHGHEQCGNDLVVWGQLKKQRIM